MTAAAQPLTPLQEAARLRNAGVKIKSCGFKIAEPSSTPKPLRGTPDRMKLRQADEAVKEARDSLDAAKWAHGNKQRELYVKMDAVDAARGIKTNVQDDYDTAGEAAVKNEARRHLESIEDTHAQWLVDKGLGKAVGAEPPSLAQAQAKIEQAEADVQQARKVRDLFGAEIQQREQSLSMAKRRRSEAQGEILRPLLEQLCARYEAAIDEAIRLRQRIFAVRDAIPGSGVKLSGLEKAVPDAATDTRNALVKLGLDADAPLDCILKPHRANGHA